MQPRGPCGSIAQIGLKFFFFLADASRRSLASAATAMMLHENSALRSPADDEHRAFGVVEERMSRRPDEARQLTGLGATDNRELNSLVVGAAGSWRCRPWW